SYTLVETQAPLGYELDNRVQRVEIKANETTGNVTALEVENTAILPVEPIKPVGSLDVTKVDASNKAKQLSGAKFVLTSVEDASKTYEFETDENGKGYVSGLSLGSYTLVETQAPLGYELDNRVQRVEIKANETTGNVTYVTVLNKKINKSNQVNNHESNRLSSHSNKGMNQVLPKTGESLINYLQLIGSVMCFSLVIIYLKYRQ
ncbi:MAG: MSCRAMM family protein, partial [Vagococcus sp.]